MIVYDRTTDIDNNELNEAKFDNRGALINNMILKSEEYYVDICNIDLKNANADDT